MKQLHTYEQYSDKLAAFKQKKGKCSTNKLFTRDELMEKIDAGRLYFEEIDNVLWFFVNEGYFYSANFYVPANLPIRMSKQDMDVLVELTGNQTRYNEQWERELILAGYEKGDMYQEWSSRVDSILDIVNEYNASKRAYFENRGMFYRKGTREDSSELQDIWERRLDKSRYTLRPLSEDEWEKIEQHGQCDVICTAGGEIAATYLYTMSGKTAYAFHLAALYKGQGLGSAALYRLILSAHENGCTKFTCWIRSDNLPSIRTHQHVLSPTGKFYIQFVCRAK